MADTKVTALTAATPLGTDLLYLVDDPGGTPSSKKATVADVLALATMETRQTVQNATGATLTKGTPVYISGFDGTAGHPQVTTADADGSGTMPAIGIVRADIANGASGDITIAGEITGLDTSGMTVGAKLYVSTTGTLTTTPPSTGTVQRVAFVSRVDAANGEIIVALGIDGRPLNDGAALEDVNDNEVMEFGVAASAVNHPKASNAATGNAPTIEAAGGDTNIDLVLKGKGTGIVKGADIAIPVAISDETTALTTGTGKLTYYMPRAFTLTGIHACVTTAPVGSSLIIDVNDGGTSIMTTNKLVIDAGENDTTTAATAPTLTDTALAAGAAITFDIDQVGSTTAGAGAKVTLMGYWT